MYYAAICLAGYIAQAYRLESFNLSNNLLDADSCLSVLRGVGNRGAKGFLRRVYMKAQQPELKKAELLDLYSAAAGLAVGFSADQLDVVDETKAELQFNKDADDSDMKRMRKVFSVLAEENKLAEAGETGYKKMVYF